MTSSVHLLASTGGAAVFRRVTGTQSTNSKSVWIKTLDGDSFVLRGEGLPSVQGAIGGTPGALVELRCVVLVDEAGQVAFLSETGQSLSLDVHGNWMWTDDLLFLEMVTDGMEPEQEMDVGGREVGEPEQEPDQPEFEPEAVQQEALSKGRQSHAAARATSSALDDLRRTRHEHWLKGQSLAQGPSKPAQREGQGLVEEASAPPRPKCPGCDFAVTWHKTHCCARCAKTAGLHGPRCAREPARTTSPSQRPAAQTGANFAKPPHKAARQTPPMGLRESPTVVFFAWIEKMALCVGNAGHEARNNLRFAAAPLTGNGGARRFRGFPRGFGRGFGVPGLGMGVPGVGGLGMGMGVPGVGGLGLGMGGGRFARIEQNPNHPRNRDPQYFRKIDNLSGQLEGLMRSVVTKARRQGRGCIVNQLLPKGISKVDEMEELTRQTDGAEIDESQRAEMMRIIGLQRQYLESMRASLGDSSLESGLPRPDEFLDFSVANAAVAEQLDEVTGVVHTRRKTLGPEQLILLSQIVCNTGHQLQNLAAFLAEDQSLGDITNKIDNLGGNVENQSRDVMVIVHRAEDSGAIPISSRQKISENCANAWQSTAQIARLSASNQLQGKPVAAELAPTLARLRKAILVLSESALLDIERELSFGPWGPKLSRLGETDAASQIPAPTQATALSRDGPAQGSSHYDVVVVGGGPAGIAAAEAVAERGMRCAIVEPRQHGFGTATGFNSKISHMAITENLRGGGRSDSRTPVFAEDARARLRRQIAEQRHEKAQVYGSRMEERLRGAGVVVLHGFAHLSGPHSLIYSDCDTQFETGMTADFIVVCTGARPRHPPRCHVDGLAVHDYKTIEEVDHRDLPASVAVIGGGVIACETSSHLAELGVQTTLLSPGDILKNLDPLLAASVADHLRDRLNVTIRTGCKLEDVSSKGGWARIQLADGSVVQSDAAVVALGSVPNTEWIGLDAASVKCEESGLVQVDSDMRTSVPHIFACGDCCTKGGLLSLAKLHGLTAAIALHRDRSRVLTTLPAQAPVIIWTVPEVATIGLRGGRAGNFDVVTRYSDCDRGILEGADTSHFLKIVYEVRHAPGRVTVRGVHVFGAQAEKLITRGVELVGKTVEEGLAMAQPAAATLEELYTLNLQAATKRIVDLRSQAPDGNCSAM